MFEIFHLPFYVYRAYCICSSSETFQKSYGRPFFLDSAEPCNWNQVHRTFHIALFHNGRTHLRIFFTRSSIACMALCSTREDCSLAAFTEGSFCEITSSASVALHHGQELRAYWDTGAPHALKDPPKEVCIWRDNFMADFSNEENVYYHVGQVQDRDTCKEVLAKLYMFTNFTCGG